MSWFTHHFEGPIERHGVGRRRKVWYVVVFLPRALADALPFDRRPQLRIEGEIADVPAKSAFVPAGDGRHYLIVSPATLKAASLVLGQTVEVRFRVADQTAVDVPDDLARALRVDVEADRAWASLTPGRRRGLAHYVAAAKTDGTRARRVAAVLAAVTARKPEPFVADDVKRLGRLLGKR
jgi:hypothetical protein